MDSLADWVDGRSLWAIKQVVSEFVGICVAYGTAHPIVIDLDFTDGHLDGVLEHPPAAEALARAKDRNDKSLLLRIVDFFVQEWGTNSPPTKIWFRMPVKRVA